MYSTVDRNIEGFTLLEMMVALSIIAVVMMAGLRLQGHSMTMAQAEQFYTVAPLLAQKRLSLLMLSDTTPHDERSGDFGDQYPEYTWRAVTAAAPAALLGEVSQRLRRLEVIISHNQEGYSYRLISCYLYD